mmetsp:Transcript_51497/g.116786  ORF Transcript_51497/g.116786 Transcript_51497/m.116786 type:complete len:447 (+) Transcript_51497:78-1418(+)
MGEQWWSAAQERLKNELVFFSWAGYPRWPGIVVAPLEKSNLLAGKGHFYPPEKKLFAETFVAARRGPLEVGKRGMYEVMHGGRWRSAMLSRLNPDGTVDADVYDLTDSDVSEVEVEDLARTKVRESNLKGVVKQQKRVAGRQRVGKHKVKAVKPDHQFVLVYSFGDEMYRWARVSSLLKPFEEHLNAVYSYKAKKASIRDHLRTADVAPFNGRVALKEAEEELRRQKREREEAEQTRQRQAEYQRVHGLAGALRPSVGDAVRVSVRPSVGDAVRVLATGRLGKIVEDDHDDKPYRVRYSSGEKVWFKEQEVSKVVSVTTPQKRQCPPEDDSSTKRPRPSLPDYLRGDIAAWGASVERGEATDRYSQDDIRRALAILNLESLPTETLLKRAFRKKAVDCHPDKVPAQRRAWATEEMQRVNWAYKLLLAEINGVAPSAPAQVRMLTCF